MNSPLKKVLFVLCLGLLTFIPKAIAALPAQDVKPIDNREYFPAALDLIAHAKVDIRVVMYLAQIYERFPDSPVHQLLRALADAQGRGVDVQVLLERPRSINNERSKDLAQKNAQVRDWLRAQHVTVFEDAQEITTHMKVLIVDKRYTIIGSTNWTYAALAKNNEADVLIDSEAVAQSYHDMFDTIATQGAKP